MQKMSIKKKKLKAGDLILISSLDKASRSGQINVGIVVSASSRRCRQAKALIDGEVKSVMPVPHAWDSDKWIGKTVYVCGKQNEYRSE